MQPGEDSILLGGECIDIQFFHGYNLVNYLEGVSDNIFGAMNNRQYPWKTPVEEIFPRVWAMEWWPVDSQGEQVKTFALNTLSKTTNNIDIK